MLIPAFFIVAIGACIMAVVALIENQSQSITIGKIIAAIEKRDGEIKIDEQTRSQEFKLRREVEKVNSELAKQNAELAKQNADLSHKITLMKQSDVLTFAGVNYLRHQYRARKLKGKTIITIIDTK